MSAYLVTTKNTEFAGKMFGLKFYNGKAVLSQEMIDPRLGYTVEEIAENLQRDYVGYELKPLSIRAQKALEAVLAEVEVDEQTKAKSASKVRKGE